MRKIKNKCRFAVLLVVCVIGTVSCASRNDSGDYTRVVLTTGFAQDEIFRIEKLSCTLPEMMVYLTNMKNQYESVYGEQNMAGFL